MSWASPALATTLNVLLVLYIIIRMSCFKTYLTPLRDKSRSGRRRRVCSSGSSASLRRGGGRRRVGRTAALQIGNNLIEEAAVPIKLRHIPEHGTAEAAKLLGPVEGSLELGAVGVATTSARSGRNTKQELDVGVLAALGPLVPDIEVEGVLGALALLEVVDATPVVVELDLDEVEGDGVESGAVGGIGVDALGSSRQQELLAASVVHQAAELGAKGGKVVDSGLEVKVETVDNSRAEGSVDLLSRRNRAEHVPDKLGSVLGVSGARPAALRVGGTTKRDGDGLALALASLDISPGSC